ncbi:MAG: hypothetical protein ABRQ39_29305, partial [Candidatus Eremiobacterota bacterium]
GRSDFTSDYIKKIIDDFRDDLPDFDKIKSCSEKAAELFDLINENILVEKFARLSGPARTVVLETIMKNPVVAQALKNSTIEGVASFMGNKAVQEIMTNAISDAVTTGVQGGLTTAMDDKTWKGGIGDGLLKVGESGAIQGGMGFATSVVMGTGLKAGEHLLGKVMPKVKADTLDSIEGKIKDPEKVASANKR